MKLRFLVTFLLSFFAYVALAKAVGKSCLVTFPKDVPPSIVEETKQDIVKKGGKITHEYDLINGFAAQVPEGVFEEVQAMGKEHNAIVEEDQIVNAYVGSN